MANIRRMDNGCLNQTISSGGHKIEIDVDNAVVAQSIPGYYTAAEAAPVLGLTKIGAAKVARAEGWIAYKVGNTHLYREEDVREYRDHRYRTQLVKSLGWVGLGLYRDDQIDIKCSCGAFAVKWPPLEPTNFMCLNLQLFLKGHEGKL